jgi:hypothetical protein
MRADDGAERAALGLFLPTASRGRTVLLFVDRRRTSAAHHSPNASNSMMLPSSRRWSANIIAACLHQNIPSTFCYVPRLRPVALEAIFISASNVRFWPVTVRRRSAARDPNRSIEFPDTRRS